MGFDEGGHSFLTLFRPEVFSVLIREGSLCMLSISYFASWIYATEDILTHAVPFQSHTARIG